MAGFKTSTDASTKKTTRIDARRVSSRWCTSRARSRSQPELKRAGNRTKDRNTGRRSATLDAEVRGRGTTGTCSYDKLLSRSQGRQKFGPDAITRPTNTFSTKPTIWPRRPPALSMTHHAAMMYCEAARRPTGPIGCRPRRVGIRGAGGKGDSAYFLATIRNRSATAWFGENSVDPDFPTSQAARMSAQPTVRTPDMYGNVWEWTLINTSLIRTRNAREQAQPVPGERPDYKWSRLAAVRGPTPEKRAPHAYQKRTGRSTTRKSRVASGSPRWTVGFRVVLPEEEQPELIGLKPKVVKKSE